MNICYNSVVEHTAYFCIHERLHNGILCVCCLLKCHKQQIWREILSGYFCSSGRWHHIPEEWSPKLHCCESLKTHKSHLHNVLKLQSSGMWHHVFGCRYQHFGGNCCLGRRFLQNVGACLPNQMASHPRMLIITTMRIFYEDVSHTSLFGA